MYDKIFTENRSKSSLKDHMLRKHDGIFKYPKEYIHHIVDNLNKL